MARRRASAKKVATRLSTTPRPAAMIRYWTLDFSWGSGSWGGTMVVIRIIASGATAWSAWRSLSRWAVKAMRVLFPASTASRSSPFTVSQSRGPCALSAIFASYFSRIPRPFSSAADASELTLRARLSAMPVSEGSMLRKGLPSACAPLRELSMATVLCDSYVTGTSSQAPVVSAPVSSSPGSRTYHRRT
ncbi:hypothetical protein AB6O49_03690 [Streptomyces sp. SBR177]